MSKTNLSVVSQAQAALGIYDTPDPTRVLGVDTSHWTGVVDWQMAKARQIKFAIIKMLDGKSRVKFAEENYKGAKDAGILVGGYTWLYRSANISTGSQAREYVAFLRDHPCDIRPTVDFEWTNWNGLASNPNVDDLYGFVTPFEAEFGKKPMIYTAPGYWNDPKYGSKDIRWADYPLWKAQYRVKVPMAITPWGDAYKFWQFTPNGKGADYGFPPTGEKEADLNYWVGTEAELYAWCAAAPPTTPTDPAGFAGMKMSISVGPDGKPVIDDWRRL